MQERRTWPKQLDSLEQAIKQQQEELKELRAMFNDAQIARDNARLELAKQEQSLYEAKKERDAKLEKCKKQAEEKKEHADKVEKRVNAIWQIYFANWQTYFNIYKAFTKIQSIKSQNNALKF